ncbi:hypothetical protein [Exiguobacterium mexicanum]|uniref:hypothetical protein n=1 Tax=Exiguobacterium mexicanum TaxID=340146 RepID=UPI0037BFBC5C
MLQVLTAVKKEPEKRQTKGLFRKKKKSSHHQSHIRTRLSRSFVIRVALIG